MKKAWISLLLSFVYPGLGHLYLGRVAKGLSLIGLEFISFVLMSYYIGIFLFPIIWIYAVIDAYKLTNIINGDFKTVDN